MLGPFRVNLGQFLFNLGQFSIWVQPGTVLGKQIETVLVGSVLVGQFKLGQY